VTGYELGSGFHDDIGTVLRGPEQIRGGEGIVNHKDEVILVGDLRNGLDIDNIRFRVPEGLGVKDAGPIRDGLLEVQRVFKVHPSGIDTVVLRESVLEQIERPAVNIVGGDDIAPMRTSAFMAYVTAAAPKATAIQATLPSKAATLSSKVA